MKKKLLLITTLLLSGVASAQFTPSNAPVIGDSILLYIVDSAAVNMEAVIGDGVTWDYSDLTDYNGESRKIIVRDRLNTAHSVTFENSNIAVETEGELLTFIKTDASERTSQGVVYNDAEKGDLILTLEVDQGLYYNYPMNFEDSIVDDIKGTATFTFMSQELNAPATGKVYTTVDGRGTLKLGLLTEYTNVLRYKLVDTIRITTIVGEYTVTHTQFEYYDHTVSNLPIFVHSYLWFGPTNGVPRDEFTFVLARNTATSGIKEDKLSTSKVYPNPANDVIHFELPEGISNAEVTVIDGVGRVVLTSNVSTSLNTLNVAHLKEGTYFVKIASDNVVTTKTLILQ